MASFQDRVHADHIDVTIDPGEDGGDPSLVITLKHRLRGSAYHTNEIRIELDPADPGRLERLADRLENLCRNGLQSVARSIRARQ